MIAFTGSTVVGKIISREAVDTMKRVALELSGQKLPISSWTTRILPKRLPMAVKQLPAS